MQGIDSIRPFKETYSKKEKSNEYQDCHRSNLFIPGNDMAYVFLFSSAHADPLLHSEFISTLSQEIIRVQKTLP